MAGPLNYASGSSIFYALSLPCFATTTMSSFMLSLLPKMPRAELVKKLVKLHHGKIELFFLP